ncbi:MFS transporter [Cohnella nanjingensis]|uniref:MFS transporter n=1 Tax=Cohnella nanjingensis TaxID=1387779 RepID=A0A7X0RQL7_9BACL|nr:MFS transporter [Cohnella nanjingensis]MBB6671894.1 MFS transporter [Cohnella nanjingensis]
MDGERTAGGLRPGAEHSLLRRNWRIDIAAAVVNSLCLGMIVPYIAVMALRFGGGAWHTAAIASAAAAANLLAIFWGRLTAGYGRVRLVFLFHGAARLALLPMAFVRDPASLAVLTLLFFALQGVATPAYIGLMRSIYPEGRRATYMAIVRVSAGLAMLAGTYVSGTWLADDFKTAALIGFALGVAGICLFALIREPSDRPETAVEGRTRWSETFAAVRSDRGFQLLLAGVFIYEFFMLLPASVYPVYQVDRMALTNGQIGLLSMATTGAALLFNPLWGRVIDKRTAIPVLSWCAVSGTLLPLAYWLLPGFVPAAAGAFAAGIASSGMDLAWMNHLSRSSGRYLSSFSGIYLSLVGFRGIAAPLCGAAMAEWTGLPAVFALSFFAGWAALVPFLLLLPASRSRDGAARHERS